MKTKLFTFFLALVASVGISSAAITVRLAPGSCSSWSTVRLWAWTDEGNLFDSWPGQIVSADDDGWYSYTFDEDITSVSIIWNNGTDQTVDIEGVTSSTCYALNSTSGKAITVSVVNCSSSQGGTPVSGKYKIGDLYYNLDATNQTAEVTFQLEWDEDNYKGLTIANIPASVEFNSVTYSVTSIGESAFRDCSSLTSVTIPNSVKSIGEYAFRDCSSLTSVTIPNSVTSIGYYVFDGCKIDKIYFSGTMEEWCIKSFNPNKISSAYTLYINGEAVSNAVIPNSVTSIADYAFWGCGLTSVTIPNSVTSIGEWAFSGCTGLTSVTIGNSVTSIGDYAFYYCSSLTSVTIPNSVKSIGERAFSSCDGLTSVTIGNSVTSIGDYAFYYCSSLTSVTIEAETPPTLDESAFYFTCSIYVPCGTLDSYKTAAGWSDYASKIKYAPYSSYNINKKAENGHITTSSTVFTMCDTEHPVICTATPDRGCYFVRWADGSTENPRTIELTQDTTMEAIFDYLLSGKCGKDSALTWTFEPASMALNITGKGALSENYTYGTFIESLTIGNEVTTIGEDAFWGCSGLTSVTIPNSVTSIGKGAFYLCRSLTSVTIGNSVTSIGEVAFYHCSGLKNVILGTSVKVLEAYAFYGCSTIESITCYSQRPPTVNKDALYGLDYSTIVYVPADYFETYKMHDAWGLYDVRPLGAKSTETIDVNVTPAENTAEVAWPAISGAATYELVIKDKSGNVICTLIFNANGQLTQIAFNAPSRNNAPQQTQAAGFSFTVTGLEEGTSYDLTITSKDNNGGTLDTKTVSFTTTGEPQGIEDVLSDQVQCTKVIKNGQVFILRGKKVYTVTGREVR